MKKIFKVLFLIVVSAIVVWYLIGFFLNLEQETETESKSKISLKSLYGKYYLDRHIINMLTHREELLKPFYDANIYSIYGSIEGPMSFLSYYNDDLDKYYTNILKNPLSQEQIDKLITEIQQNFKFPEKDPLFPIDPNTRRFYREKETAYLVLGTNLVPLIPFFESHLAEGKNYPEAVYGLIHTREYGIPTLLKTQESDFAPLRELGLTGLTTLAQYTYLENPPPKEISEEVLPYFKQYLSNPSSNRLLIDDPNRLSFEIYLDTVRCMAIEGLFFYSRSPEDCRGMILQQAIQAENPAVRYYAVMRLWYLQVRFGSMDSKTKEALQQIANNPEEEFFIRALAYNGLSCPLNRDDCENSERSLYLFYFANNELCRGLMESIPPFQAPLLPLEGVYPLTWGERGYWIY